MRKTLAVVRTALIDSFTYRGDVLLYTLSGVSHPVIVLVIWLAVIASGGSSPAARGEFIQYYLLVLLVHLWASAWAAPFISRDIRLGRISKDLLKPASYALAFNIGNNVGEKFLKSLYLIPIILVLGFFFHQPIPAAPLVGWVVFIISWFLAAALVLTIDMCIGLSAFWLEDSEALENFYDFFLDLLSGRLIPLFALPLFLKELSTFLPFRYTLSFPIEVIMGRLSTGELITGFAIQLFWVLGTFCLYQVLWKKGLVRYSAAGA